MVNTIKRSLILLMIAGIAGFHSPSSFAASKSVSFRVSATVKPVFQMTLEKPEINVKSNSRYDLQVHSVPQEEKDGNSPDRVYTITSI